MYGEIDQWPCDTWIIPGHVWQFMVCSWSCVTIHGLFLVVFDNSWIVPGRVWQFIVCSCSCMTIHGLFLVMCEKSWIVPGRVWQFMDCSFAEFSPKTVYTRVEFYLLPLQHMMFFFFLLAYLTRISACLHRCRKCCPPSLHVRFLHTGQGFPRVLPG